MYRPIIEEITAIELISMMLFRFYLQYSIKISLWSVVCHYGFRGVWELHVAMCETYNSVVALDIHFSLANLAFRAPPDSFAASICFRRASGSGSGPRLQMEGRAFYLFLSQF